MRDRPAWSRRAGREGTHGDGRSKHETSSDESAGKVPGHQATRSSQAINRPPSYNSITDALCNCLISCKSSISDTIYRLSVQRVEKPERRQGASDGYNVEDDSLAEGHDVQKWVWEFMIDGSGVLDP